jgi:hypothetical protein
MVLQRSFDLGSYTAYQIPEYQITGRKGGKLAAVIGSLRFNDETIDAFLDKARASPDLFLVKTHDPVPDTDACIYIVRDARASLFSYKKFLADFEGQQTTLDDLIVGKAWPGNWQDHVGRFMERDPKNTLVLRYEELASNLPPLERISTFLGVPPLRPFDVLFSDLRALDEKIFGTGHNRAGIASVERDHHDAFWAHCGDMMRALGYQVEDGSTTSQQTIILPLPAALAATTAPATLGGRAEGTVKSASFKIYTSIPPRVDIERQRQVLDSWRANGFTPVSVNHESEIDRVTALGLDVEIERVPTPGKPLIAEILTAIRNSGAAMAGIVNSDCVMIRYPNLVHSLSAHLEGGIFYTQRMETAGGAPTFEEACYGFDGFFFDVRFAKDIQNAKFRMGECWWDYWLPLRMGANGARLLKLPQPILFHEKHGTNWLYGDWQEYGEAFWQDLKEWHHSMELSSGLTALIDRPVMGDDSGLIAMETFRWLRERSDVAVPSLLPAEYADLERLLRVDKLIFDSGPDATVEKRELTSLGEISYALLKTSKRLLSEPALLKRRIKTASSLLRAYGLGAVMKQIVRIGRT